MKKRILSISGILALLMVLTLSSFGNKKSSKNEGFVDLFNGKNWDGWYLKIRSGDAEQANEVFAIEDGVIHVYKHMADSTDFDTGVNATHGLFYTNEKYSKYIFKFEYKWGTKITNNFKRWQYDAGCYYHVIDDKVWPTGVEYQVRYNHLTDQNHTGDLILSGTKGQWYCDDDSSKFCLPKDGGTAKSLKGWLFLAEPNVKHNALNDKWNKCEVIVMADQYAIHKLNGQVVNIVANMSVSEGVIGLQAETAEIFYRNIQIKEFDEIIPMEEFLK